MVVEKLQLTQFEGYSKLHFYAMASPCEILFDHQDPVLALQVGLQGKHEAERIEQKFSRYRKDNIVCAINSSGGKTLEVDTETADLLDFAQQVFLLSEGRFDITSGIMRNVWRFDGSDNIPRAQDVHALLPFVGWGKVTWARPYLTLPRGMEIDFGGIGKEYAVDRVFDLVANLCDCAILVNFGGDLRARGPRSNGNPWQVGVEKVSAHQPQCLDIVQGAMATSGDSQRYLEKSGVRYSHIINPKTGWPIENSPKSITAIAPTCVQAGIYSTLGLLMGAEAEMFLQQQNVQYWSLR